MKEQRLFDVQYLSLRVSLISMNRAELPPYLGSALRGVIGQALYRTDKKTFDFLYKNGENSGEKQDIVKPYMIVPPVACTDKRIVRQGEILNFGIVLLGEAVKYAFPLTRALQGIYQYGLGAKRYPFVLTQIINDMDQRILWRKEIYYREGANASMIPCHRLSCAAGAVIRLCTPLRILRGGQLLESISFQTLIRNIINRIRRITERYGGWVDRGEAEKIQILAAEIKTVKEDLKMEPLQRYSNRLHDKMDFSGLMGEIEYEGNLTPFIPWLSAAQILHIGRNTTFGMGRIEVYFY